jgi:hypothetical protein
MGQNARSGGAWRCYPVIVMVPPSPFSPRGRLRKKPRSPRRGFFLFESSVEPFPSMYPREGTVEAPPGFACGASSFLVRASGGAGELERQLIRDSSGQKDPCLGQVRVSRRGYPERRWDCLPIAFPPGTGRSPVPPRRGFFLFGCCAQATAMHRAARTASAKAAGSVTGAEHCGPMHT